jgi:hypothetical protein
MRRDFMEETLRNAKRDTFGSRDSMTMDAWLPRLQGLNEMINWMARAREAA